MKELPKHVREKIAEIKSEMLPSVNIPNSRVYKKANLIEGLAVLEYAKSLNRPVRKAMPFENEYSAELIFNRKQKKEGLIDAKTAAFELEVPLKEVRKWTRNGRLNVIKKNGKAFYVKKEIEDYRKANGPFYID